MSRTRLKIEYASIFGSGLPLSEEHRSRIEDKYGYRIDDAAWDKIDESTYRYTLIQGQLAKAPSPKDFLDELEKLENHAASLWEWLNGTSQSPRRFESLDDLCQYHFLNLADSRRVHPYVFLSLLLKSIADALLHIRTMPVQTQGQKLSENWDLWVAEIATIIGREQSCSTGIGDDKREALVALIMQLQKEMIDAGFEDCVQHQQNTTSATLSRAINSVVNGTKAIRDPLIARLIRELGSRTT